MAFLVRVGIDAESLCAIGVQPWESRTVVLDAELFLSDRIEEYRTIDQELEWATRDVERLESRVRSGEGERSALALATARQTLAAARSSWETAANGLFEAATVHLTHEQAVTLRMIHENRRRAEVPVEYLLVDRTDAEWVVLRDALAHVRGASRTSAAVSAEIQLLIANADAAPATVSARRNLQINAESCDEVFLDAVLGK